MNDAPSDRPAPAGLDAAHRAALDRYWKHNLRIMALLLTLWALVSFGCGILWADALNEYRLFGTGFRLGFWFAQQGSILTFVGIVLAYALLMNRADRKHYEDRARLKDTGSNDGGEAQ